MALRRGFKTFAAQLAAETRTEFGIGMFDRLDTRALAQWLAIPVVDLSSFVQEAPAVQHLLEVETGVFSAVTVFNGSRRTVVHNDGHRAERQASNICHELSHGLLQHPPTPAMDNSGCRVWNQDIEDEATWLAGCLLIPEPAALRIARSGTSPADASVHFGVSEQMVRYRLNATGAAIRVRREMQAARR